MKGRILLILIVIILAAGLFAPHEWRAALLDRIQAVVDGLRDLGPTGALATAGLQGLVAASGILPASFLGMAAGAAYGFVLGFLIAASGTLLGALAAFWISRSVFRPSIERFLAKRTGWSQFDDAVARDGWRFVCLIRLSPVMPFAFTSYSLGLTSISLKDYLIGTTASLPALGLYIFLGTLAQAGLETLTTTRNPWILGLLIVGALATVIFSLRVGQLAMRASAGRYRAGTNASVVDER
jgi:uncharacterized membrane protein YdjX (TVP38/TMEM64 family)